MVEALKQASIDVPEVKARRFGLIVIGDEILSGRRQDKHMSKLIELLNDRGLSLSWAKYVADDPEQITATLKDSFASGDIVFSTGGIGATPDDHTRQCAALALGTKTELHPTDLSTPENQHRFKMGEFPIGSDIIPNPYNQIPGFCIREHYFVPGFPVMAAPMMAWCLDHHHQNLFHRENWAEQSFIVPKGIESTLTPLMERIEASFPGVKVFSLPSVGDPSKGGVYAERHIELGIKGNANLLESAWIALRAGTEALGYGIHDIAKPN
jgi:molybdopterin-biosynthesis enzyme MoeA-like protein